MQFINDNKGQKEYVDSIATNSHGDIELNRNVRITVELLCKWLGIHYNTYVNWTKNKQDGRKGAKHENNVRYLPDDVENAKEAILKNTDLTIPQLVAHYLDVRNTYLGSVRWLYNLRKGMVIPRLVGNSDNKTNKEGKNVSRRTDVATAPNQVWVWDITYLFSPIEGMYYYLYTIMDLYSRYVVHFEVHETQTAELAAECIRNAVKKQSMSLKQANVNIKGVNELENGSQLVLHSDNGSPMKGKTMQAACLSLNIQCTYSRPHHSNDNPHIEASFKLLKHGKILEIPAVFNSLEHARQWCASYYKWYNEEHRHSSICYLTPKTCYEGKGEAIMEKRNKIIEEFYAKRLGHQALRENAGGKRPNKKPYVWKMPKCAVVMPFYSRQSKVLDSIRSAGY